MTGRWVPQEAAAGAGRCPAQRDQPDEVRPRAGHPPRGEPVKHRHAWGSAADTRGGSPAPGGPGWARGPPIRAETIAHGWCRGPEGTPRGPRARPRGTGASGGAGGSAGAVRRPLRPFDPAASGAGWLPGAGGTPRPPAPPAPIKVPARPRPAPARLLSATARRCWGGWGWSGGLGHTVGAGTGVVGAGAPTGCPPPCSSLSPPQGRQRMGPDAFLGLCLLGCLALPGLQASKCPRGWLDFRGHCYGYFGQELTWRKAEARCRAARGGCHLASLHTPEEHRALAAFIAQRQRRGEEEEENVWIGLYHRSQAWTWADGSRQRYSAWEGDDPPKGQRCAALEDSSGFMSWEDDSCGERKPFVCKYAA